jgi:hypothetical protein
MLEQFNNIWVIIIAVILIYIIIKKITNLNNSIDEDVYIEKHKNQERLKKQFNFNDLPKGLPALASYYVGLN